MQEITIRRLRIFDRPQVATHFQNLDSDALISRFGIPVPPQNLDSYVDGIFDNAALVFGAFPDACLRGVGELRPTQGRGGRVAEIAITVETPWQDKGIGDALLSRIIAGARNRGIREVHMLCLATNQRMRHLAVKHSADLRLMTGQVEATLTTPWPTPISMVEELAGEYHAFARAILTWPD